MKTKIALLALALGASTGLLCAQDSTPPADNPPAAQHAGPGGPRGFHLLPPRAAERLNLTDDQKKQIAALEAETKTKLEKILTPTQLEQLKNMRPPMPPGGPGRGPGGDDSGAPQGPPTGSNGDGNNPPDGPPPGDAPPQ